MGTLNEEKYRNTILYFAEHVSSSTLGKVKLMKLLYYLDFDHLEEYGAFVTGDRYEALPMGPKPVSAEAILRGMERDGWLVVKHIDIGLPFPKTEYIPLRACDIRVFLPSEVEILLSVTEKWEHHSQQDMVHATHGDPPWKYTTLRDTIDPRLVYLRRIQEIDQSEADDFQEEDTMSLRREDIELRAQGRALVARTEEFARAHPEFLVAMKAAADDIDAGEFDSFDAEGWRER